MRLIKTLLFILLSLNGFSQQQFYFAQNKAAGCWPSEVLNLSLYNKTSFSNTTDFTTNGTITKTLNGSAIDFAGGTGTFTAYATLLGQQAYSKWTSVMDIKLTGAIVTASYGIGFGLRSTNAFAPADILGRVDLSNNDDGTAGSLFLNSSSGGSIGSVPGTKLSFSLNDVIEYITTMGDSTFTFSVQNLTTAAAAIVSTYSFSNAFGASIIKPNQSNFAIYEFGGTHQVTKLTITSNEYQNSNVMISADSKFTYYQGDWAHTWPKLLNATYPHVAVASGGSDCAVESQAKFPSMLTLNPRYIIWEYGSNDLRSSPFPARSVSTVATAEDSAYNYWNPKCGFYFILIPEDSTHSPAVGQKALDNYLRSKYPSNYISAVWDSLINGGGDNRLKSIYNSGDWIHPNALCAQKIKDVITASLKLKANGTCWNTIPQKRRYEIFILNPFFQSKERIV